MDGPRAEQVLERPFVMVNNFTCPGEEFVITWWIEIRKVGIKIT